MNGRADDCSAVFRQWLGQVTAFTHARVAQQRIASGQSLAAQEPLLRDGLSYGRNWLALAMLGDVEEERGNYGAASQLYQEALTVINDPTLTPKAPSKAMIERIHRQAGQSRLLDDDYRPVPVSRDGSRGGMALENIRGFVPRTVPVPIEFEFDSVAFTPKGRKAALDMADYLRNADPKIDRVTIIGHTDERGPEDHNQGLSERRAARVAEFLGENGFEGRIETEGRGETDPFEPADPGKTYGLEQRWQMDRRVQLVR